MKTAYYGVECDRLFRNLEKKLQRSVENRKKFKFKMIYSTNKVSFFTNMKDRTPFLMKSAVVYKFVCPGCSAEYIGKTDRNLYERCLDHATYSKNSAIQENLRECPDFIYLSNQLHHGIEKLTKSEIRDYNLNSICTNIDIIDSATNWNILLIKEALHIKRRSPLLNHGLKASRELYLFR